MHFHFYPSGLILQLEKKERKYTQFLLQASLNTVCLYIAQKTA